ncbi:MAG: glycosyltransferase [Actinomycetota bacterium]|nr:glycosyltransferase [Actinomycetota bacterium]
MSSPVVDPPDDGRWPTVTLIVLNYNGLEHLPDCFNSLHGIDYPENRLELMMVDNASSDGSARYVRSNHPRVRVVESSENLGFAGGNNLGAREATGEHVIFLNNDMAVDPGFVRGLVETIMGDPEAVSAGAKILSWDGSLFDFAGSICNFTGHASQVGFEEPYHPDRYDEVVPQLFACGGAMIIDREVFLDVGGFDDDYFIYFEDVDLGWRLWLQGHKVLFAPTAVVNHRHHGTMEKFPSYRKSLLYERNALYTVLKNYGDDNLGGALAATLFAMAAGVVEEAVNVGQLDLESFSIKSRKKMDRKAVRLQKPNMSALLALHEVASDLPLWMEKRRAVQERRKRTDVEIAHLFRPYFPPTPWRWARTAYSVTQALGVQDLFSTAPRKVLVVSPDVLPYPGLPTVGSGLRTWAMGQGFRAAGHEVEFSMPRRTLERFDGHAPEEAIRLAWEPLRLGDVVESVKPDVVVACGWPVLNHLLHVPNVPLILDQHGPHMLERGFQGLDEEASEAEKLRAIRMADYFTCAGERQLQHFQDWLERAGWTEEERAERAVAVPVSLSPDLPTPDRHGEPTFVYGGMFLPWQDPSVGLETLVDELERRDEGRLLFFGEMHPSFTGGLVEALIDRLGRSLRVEVRGLVPHAQLVEAYTRSHVAIDLMKANPERRLAFTTRTVEYLWCGVPVIYNDYAELADHIREYQAGWTVAPDDVEGLRRVVADIFEHPEQVEERGRNAQRLVRDRFTWDQTIAPADHFVRHPSMRRDQTLEDRISALIPAEVTLAVQRVRSRLPPSVDQGLLRVLGLLMGTKHHPDSDGDAPIPLELAILVNRVSRTLPEPVAKRARHTLRRVRGRERAR